MNKRRILLEQFVTELNRKTVLICDVTYVSTLRVSTSVDRYQRFGLTC